MIKVSEIVVTAVGAQKRFKDDIKLDRVATGLLAHICETLDRSPAEVLRMALNSAAAILQRTRRGEQTFVSGRGAAPIVEVIHTEYGMEAPGPVPMTEDGPRALEDEFRTVPIDMGRPSPNSKEWHESVAKDEDGPGERLKRNEDKRPPELKSLHEAYTAIQWSETVPREEISAARIAWLEAQCAWEDERYEKDS